jgi:serine/threonine protein kinase
VKADIWAAGITIYQLLFNYDLPYGNVRSKEELISTTCERKIGFKGRKLSSSMKKIIKKMLAKKEENRYTIE